VKIALKLLNIELKKYQKELSDIEVELNIDKSQLITTKQEIHNFNTEKDLRKKFALGEKLLEKSIKYKEYHDNFGEWIEKRRILMEQIAEIKNEITKLQYRFR
jgi:predicted  nucleic acid-binding Zn-ribbon protein